MTDKPTLTAAERMAKARAAKGKKPQPPQGQEQEISNTEFGTPMTIGLVSTPSEQQLGISNMSGMQLVHKLATACNATLYHHDNDSVTLEKNGRLMSFGLINNGVAKTYEDVLKAARFNGF